MPKAHVEAPSIGSVLLASVVLKIGVYGVIRIIKVILRHWSYNMYMMIILGVTGSSILCLIQSDVKAYIAFSSIRHINLLLYQYCSFVVTSKIGGINISIRHGFTRAYLFLWGGIIFHMYFTRNIVLLSSISVSYLLAIATIWAVFTNFGVPFSLAFYGEVVLFSRVFIGIKLIFYMLLYYLSLVCYFSIAIRFNNTRISVFNSGWYSTNPGFIGTSGLLGSINFIVSFIHYVL